MQWVQCTTIRNAFTLKKSVTYILHYIDMSKVKLKLDMSNPVLLVAAEDKREDFFLDSVDA